MTSTDLLTEKWAPVIDRTSNNRRSAKSNVNGLIGIVEEELARHNTEVPEPQLNRAQRRAQEFGKSSNPVSRDNRRLLK